MLHTESRRLAESMVPKVGHRLSLLSRAKAVHAIAFALRSAYREARSVPVRSRCICVDGINPCCPRDGGTM